MHILFWWWQELRQVFLNLEHILLIMLQCHRAALTMILLLGVDLQGSLRSESRAFPERRLSWSTEQCPSVLWACSLKDGNFVPGCRVILLWDISEGILLSGDWISHREEVIDLEWGIFCAWCVSFILYPQTVKVEMAWRQSPFGSWGQQGNDQPRTAQPQGLHWTRREEGREQINPESSSYRETLQGPFKAQTMVTHAQNSVHNSTIWWLWPSDCISMAPYYPGDDFLSSAWAAALHALFIKSVVSVLLQNQKQ